MDPLIQHLEKIIKDKELKSSTPNILLENLIQDLNEEIACNLPGYGGRSIGKNYKKGYIDGITVSINKLKELIYSKGDNNEN